MEERACSCFGGVWLSFLCAPLPLGNEKGQNRRLRLQATKLLCSAMGTGRTSRSRSGLGGNGGTGGEEGNIVDARQ